MKTVTKDRARLFGYMLSDSAAPMPINEISNIATDDQLYGMPYGCVIDQQGQIHTLHVYATHGVIAAILCPGVAKKFGAPQPTMVGRDGLPVMAYQEFELSCNRHLPLIRISTRFDINISHGRCDNWPNAAQIGALKRFLKANDVMDDKIRTEIGYDSTGRAYLELLAKGEPEADYMSRMDEFDKEEMDASPNDYLEPELVVAGYNDLV